MSKGNQVDTLHEGPLCSTKLWEEKTLSDVTFNVGGENIQAHWNVLATWSEVFKAMFASGMRGEKSRHFRVFIRILSLF